jgi:hypothetical protein
MIRSLLAATAAFALLVAPGSAGAGPVASAAKLCSVGDSQSYGTTYVIWIRARHASCRRARKVVRGFHKCRRGPKGHCRHFNGWTCSENRTFGRGSFDSTARCHRGGRVVKHKYTQWS